MASKKAQEQFNNKVIKAIEKMGAKNLNQSFGQRFEIETKAGKLFISLHDPEKSEVFSIFCCFDDVKRANETLRTENKENLNKHSGKWNYHYRDSNSCLDIFVNSISEII